MAQFSVGQMVYIRPTSMASEEFREKVHRLGLYSKHPSQVLFRTGIGVCTVLLPSGTIIPGHSRTFTAGEYAGQEYLDLSEKHLTAA